MNLLLDIAPKVVNIEGEDYEINSDFRTSIKFELLMQDDVMTEEDKILKALNLYYPIIPEKNLSEAINKILWFYKAGKDELESKGSSKSNSTQIYSYTYDDDYIYSAFLDQYNIDLQDIEYLHWWKFKAMFKALKEDNMIVKIMGYRSMDLSKIKDKEQRNYYNGLKELYKIPTSMSRNEKEKINDIELALLGNGDLSNIL